MADRLRLFVAAYPPPHTVEALLGSLRTLDLAPHRETPAPQVHLTLQFIGDRSPRELDGVIESVERSCAGIGAFSLTPSGLIMLPDRGLPRLIAAQTDAPAEMLEIHRRLAHRLAREPRKQPADRFRPHLTLCRFANGERQRRVDMPHLQLDPFPIHRVSLMRSILKPRGAEHVELAAVPLGG